MRRRDVLRHTVVLLVVFGLLSGIGSFAARKPAGEPTDPDGEPTDPDGEPTEPESAPSAPLEETAGDSGSWLAAALARLRSLIPLPRIG